MNPFLFGRNFRMVLINLRMVFTSSANMTPWPTASSSKTTSRCTLASWPPSRNPVSSSSRAGYQICSREKSPTIQFCSDFCVPEISTWRRPARCCRSPWSGGRSTASTRSSPTISCRKWSGGIFPVVGTSMTMRKGRFSFLDWDKWMSREL